ncbi:MAG: type II toxin-antitoxin system PemK/MazF family toxin [Chloroflexi bacterium]|nr:type II toxin-antitoxin system PemK/MazF family toxin [Chloroflexota bacterium]
MAEGESIRRGDIWWLDWSPGRGSEQMGTRPALVIQNDVGNQFAPTTIVAAVTTSRPRRDYPFTVSISASESGLPQESYVNFSQLLTIDKSRLLRRAGRLQPNKMRQVDAAISVSLGLERAG